jgi:hypothetical protein
MKILVLTHLKRLLKLVSHQRVGEYGIVGVLQSTKLMQRTLVVFLGGWENMNPCFQLLLS